jgi:hypothetical protein
VPARFSCVASTVCARALFIVALAACCAPAAALTPPEPLPTPRAHTHQLAPADAGVATIVPGVRGAACTATTACSAGLTCLSLTGGDCASRCGLGGDDTCTAGACVETADGDVCLVSCATDADCRVDDGYVCDLAQRACVVPGLVVPALARCPLVGPARDAAFSASDAWTTAGDDARLGLAQLDPSLVLADDGHPIAVFQTFADGGASAILAHGASLTTVDRNSAPPFGGAARSGEAGPFDARDGVHATTPRLARDHAGTLYAVWRAHDEGGASIALATSSDLGATWSETRPASAPADCLDRDCVDDPRIVVGAAPRGERGERLYVAYATGAAGLRVRSSRDRGDSWLHDTTALPAQVGDLAVGGDGRVHVVGLRGGVLGSYGSAMQAIEYAVSADGGATFSRRVIVSARDERIPSWFAGPVLAVDDARGWVYFAYARGGRDAVWDIALVATRDGGKTFVRAALGDGCALHMVPTLALDAATGTLHVAYYDTSGAPGRFVHASCGPGLAKCAARGAIESDAFAALSLVRHAANAVGDYASLVFDDRRRALHATWAEPVADSEGRVVTRIVHASAKIPLR